MKTINHFMVTCGIIKPLMLFIILSGISGYGQSCDSSGCRCWNGDLNPSGIMIGHAHEKGKWMMSYRFMNTMMKGNLSGTEKVSNDEIFQKYIMAPAGMNMNMHMLMAMYGITDRLSVMVMFNYDVMSMNMDMLPGTMQMQMNGMMMSDKNATTMTSTSSGISDTRLISMYKLLDARNHELILSAGVSLPTGSIKVNGQSSDMMYAGQRLPYMMQLGSGTYDILPGITYRYHKQSFLIGAQVTGTYRPGINQVGYCYGNDITTTAWFSYRILPWMSSSLRVEGSASNAIFGKDPALFETMEPDSKPLNYGGKRVSCFAGLNIYLKKFVNSKFSVEYGIPVYQNLNGPQLATRSGLFAGWAVLF